ncbi:Methylated-DNA--protein-cysteine methyltransferase [Austwickia sp. TVS 96-490-7B]|nr:Methylated-DNA--protein-cysteine methyltransferase [Austwickia sp. TVS 96-490-7B]
MLRAIEETLPGGTVTAFVDDDEVLRAAGFGPIGHVAERLLTGPSAGWQWVEYAGAHPVRDAAAAYRDGDHRALDRYPVSQPGTELMQSTWRALRQVTPGAPVSYAELARIAGAPRAVRAVASACARNRIAPFVPCHRAIKTGGGLGGYAYGLAVKEALLRAETT